LGLSAIFGGVLQSFRRFLVYALALIFYNLGIIFGIIFFYPFIGLTGLAWGVVLGSFLHFLNQWLGAKKNGFRWRFVFDLNFEGLKRLLKMMPGRTLSLILNQANVIFMTMLASTLAAGSIAIYNLAYNIFYFPLGIFGIAYVTAAFPKLSEEAQKKNVPGFLAVFSSTARQILFFILPSAVLLVVLRAQLVRVILGTGNFGWQDTILTLNTLAFFAIALFSEALVWLFLRGFFAWEDSRTPFWLGLLSTILGILAAWFFSHQSGLGVAGLALGFACGSILYLIFLFIALSEKIGHISRASQRAVTSIENQTFLIDLKIFLASIGCGLAAYGFLYLMDLLVDTKTFFGIFIQGGAAGLIGILMYLLLSRLLVVPELNLFLSSISRRLPFKKIFSEILNINGK
jgi:putative peptidoglycan lipid II flippase